MKRRFRTPKTPGNINVPALRDYLPLYLRGGSILPHQRSAMNTVLSRQNSFYLYVALDAQGNARGDLFWDDGESIDTYETLYYNYFIFNYRAQRLAENMTFLSEFIPEENITCVFVEGASSDRKRPDQFWQLAR